MAACSQLGLDSPFQPTVDSNVLTQVQSMYFDQNQVQWQMGKISIEIDIPVKQFSQVSMIKGSEVVANNRRGSQLMQKRGVVIPKTRALQPQGSITSNSSQQKDESFLQGKDKSIEKNPPAETKQESVKNVLLPAGSSSVSPGQHFGEIIQITKSVAGNMKMSNSHFSLLSQHYAILKELKSHCQNFRQSIDREESQEHLWRHFQEIGKVIDAACTFLNFPLLTSK